MERSLSYDFTRSSGLAATSQARQKRLRGIVASFSEQGGTVQLANRRFSFRTMDLVSNQLPELGESVTFVLTQDLERGGYRAQQLIADSDPHYLEGQGSLSACFQAHAQSRAKRQARQLADKARSAEALVEQGAGAVHLRCVPCQKMVLPKRQRKAGQWLNFCPQCETSLDAPVTSNGTRSLLLLGLLAALIGWWQFL